MENNIFRDAGTQLDLNGPILSWVQEPTIESLTFDVDPALPNGSTTFTLSGDKGTDNFTNFATNEIYTLTPRGTFTSTIILKGAAGGSDSALDYGGNGGGVKGTVKFEKGVEYILVMGKQGVFVDDVINSGGKGNGGTAYGGNDTGTGIQDAGGAGGGFSGLFRVSVSQVNALLVAGGGGGAANNQSAGNGGGSASDGAGTDGTSAGSNTSGGKGGSLTAGGAAGIGDNLHVGDPGTALQGGNTGQNNPRYPGSAGGGGYWGGGSGAGVDLGNISSGDRGGGGGGGSSYYSTNTNWVTNASYEVADNTGGGTASFSVGQGASVIIAGVATATFPNAADNSGTIAYQWYEGDTALTDTTKFVGTATTTFTILDLESPEDNGRLFTLHVDYVPSTDYETGNAINEPLISGITTVNTLPAIEIIGQPSSVQALTGANGSISIDASLTDNSYASDLTYQWILNGEDVTDGTKTVTTTTSTTVSGPIEVNFFSPGSHTVPAAATNVGVTVAGGSGGNGGSDAGGPGGRGGKGMQGVYQIHWRHTADRTLSFKVGRKGNDGTSGGQNAYGNKGTGGVTDGGRGGGAGQHGWSGGGGGGGAATGVREGDDYMIIAGGGGGGGGGSWNRGGNNGFNSGPFESYTGALGHHAGNEGETKNGDGGGGGGGGAGVRANSQGGGHAGQDNSRGGGGGDGGSSGYDVTKGVIQTHLETLNEGDGWATLNYIGTVEAPTTTTKNTIITGSNTSKLTLSCDTVGIQTVQCRVSSPEATNTPVLSNEVTFATVSIVNDYPITVEAIGIENTATVSGVDLSNGEYTFFATGNDPDALVITNLYSFFSPDKDINVEMDLYGGKNEDFSVWAAGMGWGDGHPGGEGGYSRIRFTMEQNVEYVLTGLNQGTPFLYRQGTLIAVVGQGGKGGHYGKGGSGGGVDVDGDDGSGRLAGEGGRRSWPSFKISNMGGGPVRADGVFGGSYQTPTLYTGDLQGSDQQGGRTIACAKGVYYAEQGTGACALIGESQFRISNGTIVTNTSSITRGFKDGYNIMQTAGKGSGDGGGGGNGANGGWGGSSGGGGGGSGYTDGSVEIIATQLGGSTGDAKCILRVVT